MSRTRNPSKESAPTDASDAPETAPAVEEGEDLFAAGDVEEAVPFSQREKAPNPLEAAYLASRDEAVETDGTKRGKQKRVPPAGRVFPTEKRAEKAVALVRRAAQENDGGARTVIRPETMDDGTEGFALYFAWAPRSERKYTTADVKAWAKEQGLTVPEKGRVPKDVTTAYRIAHGHEKAPEAPAETPEPSNA